MLLQLALKGLLIALLPMAIVWASRDADKFKKLAWIIVFIAFDLVLVGGFTRLSDSGLGCPDWPGCYGHANPLQAAEAIAAAEAAMPTGPVTVFKAWVEMLHRYFPMGIGALITAMMIIAWIRWLRSARTEQRYAPGFPTALFGYVCLVGAFGALTVTQKLQPIIVTLHLLLALGLLASLAWYAQRQSAPVAVGAGAAKLSGLALFAAVMLAIQIALGGWVSTNYAAVACSEFPLCQSKLIPEMDFANGFTLWRHLGMTADGSFLPFPALTAIHWTHRMFAFVVAAVLLWLAVHALRVPGLRSPARWLLIVLALQFCTGLLTIYFQWPLALALAHNGGAALMVLVLSVLNFRTRSQVPLV